MPDISNTAPRIDAAQQTGHVDASLPQAAQTNFVTKIRFDGEGDTSPCRSISDHPPTQTTLNDLNANLLARLKDCIEDGNKTLVSFSSPRGMKNCQFLLGNQEHSSVPETQKPSLLHECLKQLALNQSESGSGKPIALGDGYSLLDFIPSEESIPSSIDSIQGKLILRNASGNQVSVDVLEMAPPFDGHSIKSAHLRECHNLLEQHASYLGKDSSQTQFGSANGIGRSASLLVLNRFKQLASADQVSDSFETVDDIINEARAIRGEKFVHTPEQKRQLRIACVAIQAAHLAAKQASRTSLLDAPKGTENSPKDLAPSSKKTPESIRFPDLLADSSGTTSRATRGSSASSFPDLLAGSSDTTPRATGSSPANITPPGNSQSKESLFPDLLADSPGTTSRAIAGSPAAGNPLQASPEQSTTVSMRSTGLTREIILQKARQAPPPRISTKYTMVPVVRQLPAAITTNQAPIAVLPTANAEVTPADLSNHQPAITDEEYDDDYSSVTSSVKPDNTKSISAEAKTESTPPAAQPAETKSEKSIFKLFGENKPAEPDHAATTPQVAAAAATAQQTPVVQPKRPPPVATAIPAVNSTPPIYAPPALNEVDTSIQADTPTVIASNLSPAATKVDARPSSATEIAKLPLQQEPTTRTKRSKKNEKQTDVPLPRITPNIQRKLATIYSGQVGSERRGSYQQAVKELKNGEKKSHWIWYVFPQLEHPDMGAFAKQFAFTSPIEADYYLANKTLGQRLKKAAESLLTPKNKAKGINSIMPNPIDRQKLHASMTLFSFASGATPNSVFQQVIDAHFDGVDDEFTMNRISNIYSSIEV